MYPFAPPCAIDDWLNPVPLVYDEDALDSIPNPLEEHKIKIDESVLTGMDMDSIQHTILPRWGKSPGAHALTKTYVTQVDLLHKMQQKYDSYMKRPLWVCTADQCDDFRNKLHTFYQDQSFYAKYNFMNWKVAEPFNQSAEFMGINTLSQYATPVLHAIWPLYVLLFPLFFVIVDWICGHGTDTCSSQYICYVYQRLNQHFIGKRIFQLQVPFWTTALLLGLWATYYLFQGYMHYHRIKAFTKHLIHGSEWVDVLKKWIHTALSEWDTEWNSDRGFRELSPVFYQKMEESVFLWRELQQKLEYIPAKEKTSLYDLPKVGFSLVQIYRLFTSESYMKALFQIPSWMEYVGALQECAYQIHCRVLTKTVFVSEEDPTYMENHAHPALDDTAIRNDASLSDHVILTGLNASGKSTCMRSVFANLLLSQSIGLGRYSACHLFPYTHFHLYVNIPDVLDKDSLFEAEVRRCKDILDSFEEGGHQFCAFDELFTGTNPVDAEQITYSYLRHIAANCPHVQFWLTTHFHETCRRLQADCPAISFHEMQSGYKMMDGISSKVNAVSILEQFGFPADIIEFTTETKEDKPYIHI